MLQHCVPNQGSAWDYTLGVLGHYFEATRSVQEAAPPLPKKSWFTFQVEDISPLVRELIGPYLEVARLVGQRTAELHLALASDTTDPDFLPNPSPRSTSAPLPILADPQHASFQLLRQCSKVYRKSPRRGAVCSQFRRRGGQLLRSVLNRKVSTVRIRCHGSYQLGQLCTPRTIS